MADGETFGEALRRLRTERGLSLRSLAKSALVDCGRLSRIENGGRRGTTSIARALDRALGANGELIAIARSEQAERVRVAIPIDGMKRRTLVTWGLAGPALAELFSSGSGRRSGRLGVADADELQDAAIRLYGLDYQYGAVSIWRSALTCASEWCAFLGPAELDGVEGTCLLELGRAARAVPLLERAVDGHGDGYSRNRALYRVRLARARSR